MHHRSAFPSGVMGARHRVGVPAQQPAPALRLDGRHLGLVGRMRAYTCGITPYDVTHLGHAAVFVWSDLLRSVARNLVGIETTCVRNVTDVDDVLTRAAAEHGEQYDEFAVTHEFQFDHDMRALGVTAPDHAPRARHHVEDVISLAAALLDSGHAYEREGGVYFRGAEVAAARGDDALRLSTEFGDQVDDAREDAMDVPVWRPSSETDPAWPSPWGWGRPGWHAECAAMSMALVGAHVDVLVGGADLAFPHHAFQAAMVEAASGAAPYWGAHLLVGTVCRDGAKMAKSTGNLVLVSELLEHHSPAALRLALLHRPWAESWEFTPDALADAAHVLEELHAAGGRRTDADEGVARVTAALLDDLDVPGAVRAAVEHGGAASRLLLDVLRVGPA
jgi:L-cysteine:1D-myo-inositol 2-amino-2-deoxy-alpha-D-glucopyranoside ligase